MKDLVIFGTGDIAELANFYFTSDTERRVAAFTVDAEFLESPESPDPREFKGLPVVPFTEVAKRYPPQSHDLFVALSYAKLNRVRKEKFLAAKRMGYELASYVSSKACMLTHNPVGEECFIGVNATLRDHITIGDRCVIGVGALILGDAEAEGVYLGPATERSRVPSGRLRKI